jgi:AcrR family transcriptional regulator
METERNVPLGRDEWIAAAHVAFLEGGIEAIKVDRLAKALKVTRGSFYWHFENAADLMRGVLELWREQQTEIVIAQNEQAGGGARERLNRLLESCARDDGRLEMGIRLWMTRNTAARDIVAKVDERRIGYLADLLSEIGKDEPTAAGLAQVAYAAWLGEYSGAIPHKVEDRIVNMEVLFRLLVNT